MATDSNTLFEEAKCLGCASNSSTAEILKLGIVNRIASAYSAVQSFISKAGITDQTQIDAVSALAESAVANGWWGKCDLIYPFVGGNATAHAQNLKSSNFTITWNGTVTHDANGITGNGTDGYGDTSYVPRSSGQILLNSGHLGIYRRTNGTAARYYAGCSDLFISSSIFKIDRGAAATTIRIGINDNVAVGNILNSSLAFAMATRIASSNRHCYFGVTDFSQVVSSLDICGMPLFVLALNNNGVASNWTNANLAGLTVGSGITFAEYQLMAADWQNFQTALGRQV